MKVCFIYREKRETGFSIEEVFRNVRRELPSSVIQLEYIVDATKSKWWNMKQVRKVEADIYHVTGDCNYMAIMLPKDKTVLTIHDIGHLEYTLKGVKRFIYKTLWWSIPLSRVSKITTVSDFTKNKVLQFFTRLDEDSITTVYNPANENYKFLAKKTLHPIPQILQIGGGDNKNIETLLEAVKGLQVKLVLVRPENIALKSQIQEMCIDFEWYSNITEKQLISIYQQIDIVYFASTYEGFGLPIIEAQLVGRPVITANVCSMPEVTGDSPFIVSPTNVNEVKCAILELCKFDVWNAEVNRGLENVKRFDPERIANLYYEVYIKK